MVIINCHHIINDNILKIFFSNHQKVFVQFNPVTQNVFAIQVEKAIIANQVSFKKKNDSIKNYRVQFLYL